MVQNLFEASDEYLSDVRPSWGSVAILPWDSEIFGFCVGRYQPGEPDVLRTEQDAFRESFGEWTRRHDARLVSSSVNVGDSAFIRWMSGIGFGFVDVSVRASLPSLQRREIPEPRVKIREALPEDRDALERIAGSVFRHGRYQADVRFPRELADRRYKRWIGSALDARAEGERVLVIGPPGEPRGFFHVVLSGHTADLRLGAVDTALDLGIGGWSLYAGTLRWARDAGARQATAKISVANMPVVNLYGSLGFVFSLPEAVLHWYAGDGGVT
jgi:hypothetical protein